MQAFVDHGQKFRVYAKCIEKSFQVFRQGDDTI